MKRVNPPIRTLEPKMRPNCLMPVFLWGLTLLATSDVQANCAIASGNPETNPDSAYQANADGTVTELATSLTWQRCAVSLVWDESTQHCIGSGRPYVWADALIQANNNRLAGYADWRLPSDKELESLVERGCAAAPTINTSLFPDTPNYHFCSATSTQPWPNNAWYVNFQDGMVSYEPGGYACYVRLVRGGQFLGAFDAASGGNALSVTSINGGVNPNFNTAFNVLVTANASVIADTTVTLLKNMGTGDLSAPTTCTIPNGGNTCTASTTWTAAGTGNRLVANASGFTSGLSDPFNVVPLPVNVTLADLIHTYDGTQQSASCATDPSVAFDLTYDDVVRINADSYGLTCTVTDPNYVGSQTGTLVINKADTTLSITGHTPDPSNIGEPISIAWTLSVTQPGGGTPTDLVSVTDGTDSCNGSVGGVGCVLTPSTDGAKTLTATYPGDANFNGAGDTEPHQVNPLTDLALTLADSLDPVPFGGTFDYQANVQNLGLSDADDLALGLTLSSKLEYLGFTGTGWGCTPTGAQVDCQRTVLGSLESSELLVHVLDITGTPDATPIMADGIISTSTPDTSAANNTDSEQTLLGAADPSCSSPDSTQAVVGDGTLVERHMLCAGSVSGLIETGVEVRQPDGTLYIRAPYTRIPGTFKVEQGAVLSIGAD